MKTFIRLLGIVIFLGISVAKSSAQSQPTFSFKIELHADGYYYAYMKSTTAFSAAAVNTTISTIQYTLVAPLGTFAPANQGILKTTTNITGFQDLLPVTSGGGNWTTERAPLNATSEYGFFALSNSPSLTDIPIGTDIPLFKFKTTACVGDIRLYRNVADATGAADTKLNNSPNSIYISGLNGGLDQAYQANYGTSAACLVPDLTTTITPAVASGVVGTAFNYTVTISNLGTLASTGSASETITIPGGLTYNSGGGNGWVCVPPTGPVAGPTTVTCTNASPNLAALTGTSSFPLVVTPTSSGTLTTLVHVSGGGEVNTSNNDSSAVLNAAGCSINAGVLQKN